MKGETDLRSLGTGWKGLFKRMNGEREESEEE